MMAQKGREIDRYVCVCVMARKIELDEWMDG